jgi:hypothetical protein
MDDRPFGPRSGRQNPAYRLTRPPHERRTSVYAGQSDIATKLIYVEQSLTAAFCGYRADILLTFAGLAPYSTGEWNWGRSSRW